MKTKLYFISQINVTFIRKTKFNRIKIGIVYTSDNDLYQEEKTYRQQSKLTFP